MKRITINRDSSGNVVFDTVTVDTTELVFFLNLDSQSEHWPDICAHPVGAAPSDPSSQCFPEPTYRCRIAGHGGERGIIDIIQPLAGANTEDFELTDASRITISRDSSGNVVFDTITVASNELVFFRNLDSQSEHWPDICAHPVGAAPSDPSKKCFPEPTYGCRIAGHEGERGIINIIQPLAGDEHNLDSATKDR